MASTRSSTESSRGSYSEAELQELVSQATAGKLLKVSEMKQLLETKNIKPDSGPKPLNAKQVAVNFSSAEIHAFRMEKEKKREVETENEAAEAEKEATGTKQVNLDAFIKKPRGEA